MHLSYNEYILANETWNANTAKHSCKNFLATLLSLAGTKLAGSLEVQKLIQDLVHGTIDPETFTAKLQIDSYLSTEESKHLIPFLKGSLGLFQIALLTGELSIDGIHPKPIIRSSTIRTEITKPKKLMGHIGFTGSEVTRNQSLKVKGVTEDNKSKELTENSKAKEVSKIKQMIEVKLEAEKTNIVIANSTKADSKVENVPIKNAMDVFKPDGNNMIPCKGCGANCKDIRKHLTKTRYSIKCESKYSSEQLSALDIGGATPVKESTENSKAKEVTQIRQMTEVKLEADDETNISIANVREIVPKVPTSQLTQVLEVNEITLRNDSIKIDSDSIKNVMDVFKPDGNNMIQCVGCNANCKDIRRHLIKMRYSIKCESKYSPEQISALYDGGTTSVGQLDKKELTENSKAKEATKIGQIIGVKSEADENFREFDQDSMKIRIELAKVFTEAKSRALTLANETWNSDTAKHSCKNFLATLISLAKTRLTGFLEVLKLIQDLIDGAIDPETFTAKLQLELYLSSDESECLMPFLKRSLGYLKNDLLSGELSIDGIQPLTKNCESAIKKELAKNNDSKKVTKIGEMTEAKLEPDDTNIANVGEIAIPQLTQVLEVNRENRESAIKKELAKNNESKEVTTLGEMTESKLEPDDTNIANVGEIAIPQRMQVLEVNQITTGNVEDITKGLFSFTIVYFLIICFITFAWQIVVKFIKQ